MIYRAPELEPDEAAVIAAIDAIHCRLRDRILIPARWRGVTFREIFVRTLAQGVARTERAPRVAGYNRAMSYVLQRRDDPHFRYDLGLISALHFMINEEDTLAWPGKWRAGEGGARDGDGLVVYRAPAAGRIPGLMDELIENLNCDAQAPAVVRAATAMLNFIRIHPFRDGNGRLGRSLYSLVMARAGYLAPAFLSIEEYVGYHREEYDRLFNAMGTEWEPSLNTRPWLRFCLIAHYRQAMELLGRFQAFARVCVELGAHMARVGVESGAGIAASELFAAPSAEQLLTCPRLATEEIESAVGVRAPFRFGGDLPPEPHHQSRAALNPDAALLLDEALLRTREPERDPFEILQACRTARALNQSASQFAI